MSYSLVLHVCVSDGGLVWFFGLLCLFGFGGFVSGYCVGAARRLHRRNTQGLAHLVFDLDGELGVFFQKFTRVVAALTDFFAIEGILGTGFFNDVASDAQIEHLSEPADAFAVQNVKLRRLEG